MDIALIITQGVLSLSRAFSLSQASQKNSLQSPENIYLWAKVEPRHEKNMELYIWIVFFIIIVILQNTLMYYSFNVIEKNENNAGGETFWSYGDLEKIKKWLR